MAGNTRLYKLYNMNKKDNYEIEKKYLINIEDIPFNLKKYKSVKIAQAYISKNPSIRIRNIDNNYVICIKSSTKKDYTRIESEYKISKKTYNNLLKSIESGIIYKTRYFIPYNNYTIELDIFERDLKGLCYAEVEFNSIKQLKSFKEPSWFKKDVSKIKKYSNESLAYSLKKH